MVLSGPSLMRQVSSTYWRRCMVLSGLEAVIIYVLERCMVLSGPSL